MAATPPAGTPPTMDVFEATTGYEAWMRRCTPVVDAHLRRKHEAMRGDAFGFLRGTFYRWAQLWPRVCPDLQGAPRVLAVGDCHVNSFGTWRDAEGRLGWGVDDFDEAYPLPYPNDLVRLAASAKIVIDSEQLRLHFTDACDAILEGYAQTLRHEGCPLVLSERETSLAQLGIDVLRSPVDFWHTLQALPVSRARPPRDVTRILARALPDARLPYKLARREAGVGSLGQQRFVAIADWPGGLIAREVKAMMPSACVWLETRQAKRPSFYQRVMEGAVRSRDPYQTIAGGWLVRRLSPDANPIDIATLPKQRDEETLLQAMGRDVANVHLGSRAQIRRVVNDLRGRKAKWLRLAAKDMAKVTRREWKAFRQSGR
jgi:hypothetical protein